MIDLEQHKEILDSFFDKDMVILKNQCLERMVKGKHYDAKYNGTDPRDYLDELCDELRDAVNYGTMEFGKRNGTAPRAEFSDMMKHLRLAYLYANLLKRKR